MRSLSTLMLLSPLLSLGLVSSATRAQVPGPAPIPPAAVPAPTVAPAPVAPAPTVAPTAPSPGGPWGAPPATPSPNAASGPPASGPPAASPPASFPPPSAPPASGPPASAPLTSGPAPASAPLTSGPPAPPATPGPGPATAGATPASAPASAGASGAGATAGAALKADGTAAGSITTGAENPPESTEEGAPQNATERGLQLQEQNSLWGGTGLLRTLSASSGPAGSFRLHFLADWFQASGFLCHDTAICSPADTVGSRSTQDSAEHYGMRIGLSVTPIEWLEAYATIRSESNSNNSGTPRLLQVLGDTAIGAKAFMPNHLGQMFNFGGALDVLFMNGTGGVGLNAGATSFKLKGLSTVDFREPNDQGLPLRVHANVGFFFDNSASIVTQIEDDRAAQKDQRGKKITRLERFGLGINRVDQFQLGIGVEGMFSFVRPFVEWNLGAPVNWRQQYQCNPKQTYSGDTCLGLDESLSVMPSILTLGARVYPYKGLAATAALDLGTGATSKFIEEVAPVPEWDLWLGLSYAVDTQEAPAPKPQVIEKAVASPLGKVRGVVHEKDKTEGVANAIVRYEGRPDLTAMVTSADGVFLSTGLPPGSYTFSVTAEGYKPGQCVAVVAAPVVAPPASPAGAGSPPASPAGSPIAPALPASTVTGDTIVALDCAVEAQPKVGSITGRALDADTGATLTGASVRLMDLQTRELALPVENGTFHVENLNPGMYTLKADAPDHMLHAQQVEVKAREDAKIDLRINKRPTKGDVEIAGNEVKLKRQIHFETDSARILPDSTALLEEIADVLARNPCLQSVEIQGHTDNMGIADHNKSLSEQRANSVRAWLADHGVESSRMVAKGYGQDKPISPNITPAGRERNRRVQFMILQKDKNCGKPGAAAGKMSGGPATTGAAAGAKTAPMPKLPKPPMPF